MRVMKRKIEQRETRREIRDRIRIEEERERVRIFKTKNEKKELIKCNFMQYGLD